MVKRVPLAKCEKVRPSWLITITKEQDDMTEKYKSRRLNYFLDIVHNRNK